VGAVVGTVAIILVAVVVAVTRHDPKPSRVAVSSESTAASTTATTGVTAAAVDSASDSASDAPTTVVVTTRPSTTRPPDTTPPDPCANSTDPACGPFRWSVANQPLTVSVTASSTNVQPGEQFTLTVMAHDGDEQPSDNCYEVATTDADTGYGPQILQVGSCNSAPCFDRAGKYGTWTAPPRPAGRSTTFQLGPYSLSPSAHYDVIVHVTSGNPYCEGGPYSSSGQDSVLITVG
jgi:hypothetical protein